VGARGALWAGAALGGALLGLFALLAGRPSPIVAALLLSVVGAVAGGAVAHTVWRGQGISVLDDGIGAGKGA
jgi:hypothetical protein